MGAYHYENCSCRVMWVVKEVGWDTHLLFPVLQGEVACREWGWGQLETGFPAAYDFSIRAAKVSTLLLLR